MNNSKKKKSRLKKIEVVYKSNYESLSSEEKKKVDRRIESALKPIFDEALREIIRKESEKNSK